MSTRNRFVIAATTVVMLAACAAHTNVSQAPTRGLNLGRVAASEQVAAWDISIPPSGAGLPSGSGSVKQGAQIYAAKCQSCHGANGAGKPIDALAGGFGTLASDNPVRTVGSYWPYATTLFDYVRRAMPQNAPMSLTNDEVYALSAYILHLNHIVPDDAVMNREALLRVNMPNRDGFIDWSRK